MKIPIINKNSLNDITMIHETTYTIDDSIDVLLEKLDSAIDDIKNGRVKSLEKAWAEIDSI